MLHLICGVLLLLYTSFNSLNTKINLNCTQRQTVPRSKHSPSLLQKPAVNVG